jgi:hypothetical protein
MVIRGGLVRWRAHSDAGVGVLLCRFELAEVMSRDHRPHECVQLLHFTSRVSRHRKHAVGDSCGLEALAADHMDDHGAVERREQRTVISQALGKLDDALGHLLGRGCPVAFENPKWMEPRFLE